MRRVRRQPAVALIPVLALLSLAGLASCGKSGARDAGDPAPASAPAASHTVPAGSGPLVAFLGDSLRQVRGLMRELRTLTAADRARVLTIVAALGIDPERILVSATPSPGEARKLKLAFGLGTQVWALVLDEPTNHLDIPAIERLVDSFADYPGALVMVTHDDALAACCTTI